MLSIASPDQLGPLMLHSSPGGSWNMHSCVSALKRLLSFQLWSLLCQDLTGSSWPFAELVRCLCALVSLAICKRVSWAQWLPPELSFYIGVDGHHPLLGCWGHSTEWVGFLHLSFSHFQALFLSIFSFSICVFNSDSVCLQWNVDLADLPLN